MIKATQRTIREKTLEAIDSIQLIRDDEETPERAFDDRWKDIYVNSSGAVWTVEQGQFYGEGSGYFCVGTTSVVGPDCEYMFDHECLEGSDIEEPPFGFFDDENA